jgi:raffinose/stachyose/melibiose transport system permease protein
MGEVQVLSRGGESEQPMITMVGKAVRRWWGLFALPTFAAFIIGFLVPFIMGIYLSFTKFTTVTDAQWVGLRNYRGVFSDKEFIHALWYTVAFTVITTVIVNIVAFAIAYMLTKTMKGSNLFRSVFFMPNLIGGIILGYIWLLLLNGVLAKWGRSITFSGTYGFWGMVMLVCWQQIGYMMIIYIAGMQSLPGDVIEAAAVDGASGRQTLTKVIIPLMMPSITVCSFLTVTNGFKMFDQNLALTNGAPSNSSELLALNIFRTFYGRIGFEGVGQAKAVVFFLIVAVIVLLQNRLTTSKEVAA